MNTNNILTSIPCHIYLIRFMILINRFRCGLVTNFKIINISLTLNITPKCDLTFALQICQLLSQIRVLCLRTKPLRRVGEACAITKLCMYVAHSPLFSSLLFSSLLFSSPLLFSLKRVQE